MASYNFHLRALHNIKNIDMLYEIKVNIHFSYNMSY